MEIKIVKSIDKVFKPEMGIRMNDLISRFRKFLDEEEIHSLIKETNEILSQCTNPNLHTEQDITHLTVGYVQSGKTMSFTSLTALAGDNGYRIVVFLTGTKNNLLTQTTERLNKDLIAGSIQGNLYKIRENPSISSSKEIRNNLRLSSRPTILITVLKHPKHVSELAKIFKTREIEEELRKQGVLIIDDEADQASLNGFAYENSKKESTSEEWEETDVKESSTYSSILNLRANIPNHSYVQYTATPQGPILISILDLLSPKSHTVLTPGKKYTGGKTFFQDFPDLVITIPNDELGKKSKKDNTPDTLKKALQVHILNIALNVNHWKKVKFLSMMVHADRQKNVSRLFYKWIQGLIEGWTTILNFEDDDLAKIDLEKEFMAVYENESKKFYTPNDKLPTFLEIKKFVSDSINDTKLYLIISDKDAEKKVDWDSCTSHILVGADMLNRGYTVENLAITYMPRQTKGKSNADTIQQRCRFFGYKQDYLKSCRVYLPKESISEYNDYVLHEEEMRNWLKSSDSLEKVQQQLILTEKLNATRKNILPYSIVQSKMRGWHSMNAFKFIDSNKIIVENFLNNNSFELWHEEYKTNDRRHRIASVSIDVAVDFLTKFKFGNFTDTARKQATIRYIQYLEDNSLQKISKIHFIQMAFESEYRERAFNPETLKIDQLFSGESPSGSNVYPGDREIKLEDTICIQLHKIKLNSKQINKYVGKTLYTIAIYYPEKFASGYTTTEKDKLDFENN
jgi:hypothetical protein